MSRCRVTVVNKLGIHARSAARFIELARTFPCEVKLGASDATLVDGKSIMKVMQLAAGPGDELTLLTEGPDDDAALQALADLIANRFGEEE